MVELENVHQSKRFNKLKIDPHAWIRYQIENGGLKRNKKPPKSFLEKIAKKAKYITDRK